MVTCPLLISSPVLRCSVVVLQPRMSVVRHPFSLDGEPVDMVSKKFAVVEFSGRQYKITEVSRD